MNHYDAIVVGAGPAGGAAAFELARAGARVALIEKQKLPRHKTCGGGMPMVVSQVLHLEEIRDLAPEAFVEADTRFMRHTYMFDDPILSPMNPEGAERNISLWMVRRAIFDNALAQRAAAAGAELRDGLALKTLENVQSGPITVRAESASGSWEATADTVIGADGANGITAKLVGMRKERSLAIAIEAEVPHTWGSGHVDLRPDVCHLEYGVIKKGYAWVFPKGDHLNVGAGVFRPNRQSGRGDSSVREKLQSAIVDYLQMLEVPHRPEDLVFHAHPLPIWDGQQTVHALNGRVLLAGDAAGLINPFFGDGILHALKSGQIAAACILEKQQADYSNRIAGEFKTNFDAALKMAKFFYQWPSLCYKHGAKRPTATRTAAQLLCGDAMFDNVAKRAMRRLNRALKSAMSGANPPSPELE